MKSKSTAVVLALFLGGFGAHKFYLDRPGLGVVYLIFFWTFVPAIIAVVDGVVLLLMSENEFNVRFNQRFVPAMGGQQVAQSIVIHNSPPVQAQPALASNVSNISDQIVKLNELRVAGVITEEEFVASKRKLMA